MAETQMTEERLTVTVSEAAKMLGIARGTAYEQCKAGAIPHLKFGKKVVVPRKAIERMLDAACQGAAR